MLYKFIILPFKPQYMCINFGFSKLDRVERQYSHEAEENGCYGKVTFVGLIVAKQIKPQSG